MFVLIIKDNDMEILYIFFYYLLNFKIVLDLGSFVKRIDNLLYIKMYKKFNNVLFFFKFVVL